MKYKINKLINDYEAQIRQYDRELSFIGDNIRECRKGEAYHDMDELRQDRKIVDAQRQRTVQFLSDLKYL